METFCEEEFQEGTPVSTELIFGDLEELECEEERNGVLEELECGSRSCAARCEEAVASTSEEEHRYAIRTLQRVLGVATSGTSWESQVRHDVESVTSRLRERSRLSVPNLAGELLAMGYKVCIKHGSSFSGHVHEFLVVSDHSSCAVAISHAVIDVFFRDIFEIPRPNDEYSKLLSVLPPSFVSACKVSGAPSSAPLRCMRLEHVTAILCRAVETSLTESGLDTPPWRSHESVRKLWFSEPHMEETNDDDFWQSDDADSPTSPLIIPKLSTRKRAC